MLPTTRPLLVIFGSHLVTIKIYGVETANLGDYSNHRRKKRRAKHCLCLRHAHSLVREGVRD